MRRDSVLALALLTAGFALSLLVMPWSDERVNDLFVYRSFVAPLLDGQLPYRDVFFEYPPLAAPAIALPGVVAGTGEEAFRLAFAGWTLLLAAAVVLLCGALAARTGGDRRRALLAAALMPFACGALLRTHFDLAPVALTLAALLLVVTERPRSGLALLGVGAMTKLFPLAVVPVALAWLLGRGRARDAWRGGLACSAVMAAVALAALALSPSGAWGAVEYHLERPVQIESLPALALLGLDAAGLGEALSVASHRSDGLEHSAAGALSVLTLLALTGALGWLSAAAARGEGRAGASAAEQARVDAAGASAALAGAGQGRVDATAARRLVLAGLAAVAAFAVLGRVLSPQFVIWVLPLGALAFAWRMHALALAVAAAALLTLAEFPARYFDVVEREPLALALVGARNAALLVSLALCVRELRPQRQQQLLDARRTAIVARLD